MYQRVPAIGNCHRPILATAKPRALCRCDDEERRTPLVKELIDTLSVNRQVNRPACSRRLSFYRGPAVPRRTSLGIPARERWPLQGRASHHHSMNAVAIHSSNADPVRLPLRRPADSDQAWLPAFRSAWPTTHTTPRVGGRARPASSRRSRRSTPIRQR